MEDQNQNPEKIPLNPVNPGTLDSRPALYSAEQDNPDAAKQILSGMHRQKTSQPKLPLKYTLLLIGIILLMALVAFAIGRVLFKDGLV